MVTERNGIPHFELDIRTCDDRVPVYAVHRNLFLGLTQTIRLLLLLFAGAVERCRRHLVSVRVHRVSEVTSESNANICDELTCIDTKKKRRSSL